MLDYDRPRGKDSISVWNVKGLAPLDQRDRHAHNMELINAAKDALRTNLPANPVASSAKLAETLARSRRRP